jgi:hypothetical protein
MRSRFSAPLIFAGSTIDLTATQLPRHMPAAAAAAAQLRLRAAHLDGQAQ